MRNEHTYIFIDKLTDIFKQQILGMYRKRYGIRDDEQICNKVSSFRLGVKKIELWQKV